MDKQELLALTRSERAGLDDVYKKLTEDEVCAPVLDGGWSMKDVLAHVTAWERRILDGFEAARRGEPPAGSGDGGTQDDTDRLNQQVFLKNHARPLVDVLAEARATHADYVALIESLSDRALAREFAPGTTPEMILRNNGDQHYREHLDQIEAWWAGQGA